MKLNLGCGAEHLTGWTGVDIWQDGETDVVHDLDVFPWPFGDGSASEIRAMDIFEHVASPIGFMAECHRILAPGGTLHIRTSRWDTRNSYTDPTHRRFCTEETFDYWVPGTYLNQRYGAAYAHGRHFEKIEVRPDGQELEVLLRRA